MGRYPWQAQYEIAMQVMDLRLTHRMERITECVALAKNKIYDRLEDYLRGRLHLDAQEWQALKEALCFLRGVKERKARHGTTAGGLAG